MKIKWRKFWRHWGVKIVLLVLTLGFFGAGILTLWLVSLPIPDFNTFSERQVTESTKIYDRTGKILLYDIHENVKRQVVPFEEISKNIKNATVAIEDAEFYHHHGIEPKAILRAILVNLRLRQGSLGQGGSTITQQLIKNSLLTQDKKITRKLKEVVLALKIERAMTKEQILGLYLNETPYGGNIYGIEEAAQSFFQKPASEVTLAEAAYLAALPQAPTFYSPYGSHRDRLEDRKNLVLKRMGELGFITDEEAKAAEAEKVSFAPRSERGIKAPHFVEFVRSYLEEKYGREALLTKGFKVTTTLNWPLEQKAEEIVKKYGEENQTKFNAGNAGLVAIDPKTGQILVMVGSRDYFDITNEGNFNITTAHRQPGSSFKPIVYAQAFNKGYAPETMLFDLPTQFDTTCAERAANCYKPTNYDDKYRGPIDLRHALAQSINIPSIKVLYLAGLADVLKLARDLGIESLGKPGQYGLTLVLGGGEVSLLDLTSAYGVFANEGARNPYASILKIEDDEGQVLEEFTPASRQVLPINTARLISNILSDNEARVPTFAINSPLTFPNRQVAAKTGTTNDYKDAWVLGYTPSIVAGAWVGNNDNTPMEKKVAGFIVAPLWHAFMAEALKTVPVETFTPPLETSLDLPPVHRGFWQGGKNYFIDKISGKLATDNTPEETKEEHVLTQIHSILYWLGRTDDSQFKLWEPPIRVWAASQNIKEQTEADLPTATDDVHLPGAGPNFSLTSPTSNGSYGAAAKINVELDYRGRWPLAQVDVFVNNQFLGSTRKEPFVFSFIPEDLDNPQDLNQLRVVVYDSVRNQAEQSVDFQTR